MGALDGALQASRAFTLSSASWQEFLTLCWCCVQKLLEGDSFAAVVDNRNIDVRDVAEAHILAAELPHAKVYSEDYNQT